tara:strand:+ start:50156 stop:50677 length:522 start_codon:yes stop_codon:yes gene_type:complete
MTVILRKLKESDHDRLAELANNKNISKNLRDYFPDPYTLKDAESFIAYAIKEMPQLTFVIDLDSHFCGIISLGLKNDVYQKNGEIGYWIGEPFWGKGVVTEAVNLILKYAFSELNLERIYGGIFSTNIGSMKVLEKNGFIKEGILKNTIFKNSELQDEHLYSILKDDYFSRTQ